MKPYIQINKFILHTTKRNNVLQKRDSSNFFFIDEVFELKNKLGLSELIDIHFV